MPRQLRLDLAQPPALGPADLVVSAANADAVAALAAWPGWPGGVLALVGPAASGKSHMARLWAEKAGAISLRAGDPIDFAAAAGRPVLADPADGLGDEALFHLINQAGASGGGLLLVSRTRPVTWPAALPDLRSRLNAATVIEVDEADDAILEGALRKFFRERNIRPHDDLIAYLVNRIERSVPAAWSIVERLDEVGQAERREINRVLARQLLEEGEETRLLFD